MHSTFLNLLYTILFAIYNKFDLILLFNIDESLSLNIFYSINLFWLPVSWWGFQGCKKILLIPVYFLLRSGISVQCALIAGWMRCCEMVTDVGWVNIRCDAGEFGIRRTNEEWWGCILYGIALLLFDGQQPYSYFC